MNFSFLEYMHKKWRDILVIGKTIERNNKNYHIVGMTLAEEAKLYIIEPCNEPEHAYKYSGKAVCSQRKMLKGKEENEACYLHCSDFYVGNKRLRIQGGSSSPLKCSSRNYGEIQLFFDMMSAGWSIPEWLKNVEWDHLQLVTLDVADMKRLPKYSSETPIIIKHAPGSIQHILEKTITLNVGKSRSFRFIDHDGDQVRCYINHVTLIDVWKDIEDSFNNPQKTKGLSPEQLRRAKSRCYEALEQSCPKGMCYIGIEYECSKDMSLQFYSKQYLKSCPKEYKGSSSSIVMMLKPEKEKGAHTLPLKGCVIQTAVPPDTSKIPAELFCYFEKEEAWEETVC